MLQKEFGPNAAIRTDEGSSGNVYLRIVSDRFDGLSERTKQEIIWEAASKPKEKLTGSCIGAGVQHRPNLISGRRLFDAYEFEVL